MTTPPQNEVDKRRIFRLMIFFALAYIADGVGQASGLISQPLSYYLMTVLHWDADKITQYLTILILPWIIKPIYGMISDFVPLFGYRRKTWLFATNFLAVIGYLWLVGIHDTSSILIGMFLSSLGIAASTALCGALMVESGKRYSMSGTFVNQQWMWFFGATVFCALIGGALTQYLSPLTAFHTAAFIAALVPIGVLIGVWTLVQEERATINVEGLKISWRAFISTFGLRIIWLVGLFIFFYQFSPSFGQPLFAYQTKVLLFPQGFIGILGAIGAGSSVLGGFLYQYLQSRMTTKQMLMLSIGLGMVSQASYLLLMGPISAVILAVVNGIFGMITLVTLLTLAADFCPDGAEGFAYALLLSVSNFAQQVSENVGATLYVHVFNHQLSPLIILSAAVTGLAFFFMPLLKLGNKKPGEKANLLGTTTLDTLPVVIPTDEETPPGEDQPRA
jgi:MFS family permease